MEAVMEIYKKIPLVMHEIGAIEKDRKNQQQGYQFRGIDDIYNAVNSALSRHGVFCVPCLEEMKREERQSQKGGTLFYTILTIKYVFYASDGSSIEVRTVGEAMDSGDKSCNKAMSAAQKYAFLQVFCIPTEEPKDTEEETHEVAPKKPSKTPAGPPSSEEAPPPPSNGKTTTHNYKFLEAMAAQKKRLGEEAYYRVLGANGYEHANLITDREAQVEVFHELLAIPDLAEAS